MLVRRRRTRNYTNIDNDVFDDEWLIGHSLGVLTYLLSRPNDWEVQPEHLQKRFGIGRDRFQKIMRLLRKLGYARIEYEHDAKTGKFRNCGHVITDEPIEVQKDLFADQVASPEVAEAIEAADSAQADVIADRLPEKAAHGSTVSLKDRQTAEPSDGKSGTKETTTERKQNPHKPPRGPLWELSLTGLAESPSKTAELRFERLRSAWVSDPTIVWTIVEREFFKLSASDQEDACRIAPRYVGFCQQAAGNSSSPGVG